MNQANFQLLPCPSCGTKNRIPVVRGPAGARCGKCGQVLAADDVGPPPDAYFNFRCQKCKTKNRIPAAGIDQKPQCGKCKSELNTRELFFPQPMLITDTNFEDLVVQSPVPVLVYAWAPWCPTCSGFSPIVDAFAHESKGKVRVAKLNVDANPALSSRFGIMSVPMLLIFDNGKLRESQVGGLQKHALMMKLAPYL